MSENISSIEYSLNYIDGDSIYKNSLSIIVTIVGFFSILPILALMGYLFDVRESAYKNEEIPEFKDYERLVKEGYNGFVAYTPLLFVLFLSLIVGVYYPPFLFVCTGLVILLWPAVSIKYSMERNYKEIYGSGVIDIVLKESYLKKFMIYIIFMIIMIATILSASLISFGLGSIVLIPVFFIAKSAYWGYVLRDNNI